ncbi:MAG: DNA polymerase III subunit delta' [Thermoleophilia bacterium]
MPLFADILGQPLAVTALRQALTGDVSHAYLFTGPPGVGKSEAALAFAAGLACRDGGCSVCDTCRRVLAGLHPDVELVVPEGAFITIEQIREINRDVAMKPFESAVRVYVILEAHALNVVAANAFLKTLEEPPQHAHFILVTHSPETLPQTVISRCRRVPFVRVSAVTLAEHLRSRYGVEEVDAVTFARVAQGSSRRALELATDPGARAQRERLLGWARGLGDATPADALVVRDEILGSVEKRADERVASIETDTVDRLAWAPDARTRARIEKLREQRVKRERRRAVTEGLDEVMVVFTDWHRDLAMVGLGAEETVFNHDFLFELRDQAFPGLVDRYLAAVDAIGRTRERFRYNVDARSALEEMLFSIREALR